MADLKSVVNQEYDSIAEGIAWVVIYKEGRGWESACFWNVDGSYDEGLVFCDEDMEKLRQIAQKDHKAICINGYYMGFGFDFTKSEMEDRILFLYTTRLNQLNGDFLGGLVKEV